MDLKNYSTGVQHIGIPTNDIGKTVEFYHKLGFVDTNTEQLTDGIRYTPMKYVRNI